MRIYLVGFMGAGKSAYGRELANITGYIHLDTDDMVVKTSGQSIPDIFQSKGEKYFRELEGEVLTNTLEYENCIVSTGGGLPCYGNHMQLMVSSGISIFLKSPLEELHGWILKDKANRPMVSSVPDEQLFDYIQKLYQSRMPFYRQAAMVISPEDTSPAVLARLLKL